MSDENPITQKLAAISGLGTGKRVIAPGVLVAPSWSLPEPDPERQPAPRQNAQWSPERREAHKKRMLKMWSDPAKREEIKRRTRSGRNRANRASGR